MLKIAADLSLPLDVVTEKLAFLGRTGSGKSYAASKLAELMLERLAQTVILDPVGVWFGLRLGADGKGKGLEIPVFGGLHGDIPLEATAGSLVADLIVDRSLSAVLDVSQFIATEQARFATDFATRFFQRKKAAPSAVHIFIEECQEFVPQNVMRGEERVLHAFERLLKLGRNFGIGASLISQRPQEINKKALNQAGTLFVFHMTGPQERKAIESWVADKGVDDDIAAVLPKLRIGEAHVWSPQWLRVSKTVHILQKWTFDASSTPKVGSASRKTEPLAPIDVEKIRVAMAATIERAKAEDPRELRRQIAELQGDVRKRQAAPAAAPAPAPRPDPEALACAKEKGRREVLKVAAVMLTHFEQVSRRFESCMAGFRSLVQEPATDAALPPAAPDPPPPPIECSTPLRAPREIPQSNGSPGALGNTGLRRMLVALAQRPGLNARQIGVRAGLSSRSGTFTTYLASGRTNGWIEGTRERLKITDAGRKALGDYTLLPEGRDLLAHWLSELGNSGAARMLQALHKVYPRALSAEELGEHAELSSGSGTFTTYLSKLRTLELVTGGRDDLRASEELF